MTQYSLTNSLEIETPNFQLGNKLDQNNRWIVLSRQIPWRKVLSLYKKAIPLYKCTIPFYSDSIDQNIRIITGTLLIKHYEGIPFEKVINLIEESPYLQYLLGFNEFKPTPIREKSILILFLNRIDSLIIQHDENKRQKKVPLLESKTDRNTMIRRKLAFRSLNGLIFIDPKDVIYIKAEGNYSTFFLENKQKETVTSNLGQIFNKLDPTTFIRINRSFIINFNHLSKINTAKKICLLHSSDGEEYFCSISKEQILEFSKKIKEQNTQDI